MKRILSFALALIMSSAAVAAAPPQPGPTNPCLLQPSGAELVLDVAKLPAKVELSPGQNVVITSKVRMARSKLSVSYKFDKGSGNAPDPLERLNIAAVIRKGCQVVAVYQGKNEGKGEFIITLNGKTLRVPFTVQGVAASSGLEGNVVSGPHKPVSRPGDPDGGRPVAGAVIIVEDANGNEVARTIADAKGAFKVVVAPGKYTVTARFPNQKGSFPMPASCEVSVPKQGYQSLNIKLDTGVRKSEKSESELDPVKFRDQRDF